MRFIDQDEIRKRLTYDRCIPLMREAMIAVSGGETKQTLRQIVALSEGRLFGTMPGALGAEAPFGAKLISVFHGNAGKGIQSHQGVVVLFDPDSGAAVCVLHAGEITAIRTGAASAAATEALARKDASRLAILGCGEQALTHTRAIAKIRVLRTIVVWGRDSARAGALAEKLHRELELPVTATASARAAVEDADIICTVSAAADPILRGAWVKPGAHVNVVGSSYAGPVEIDTDLVVRSRFFADSREGVIAQGAEFIRAKQAGLVGDAHILAEIGEVFAGEREGRVNETDITLYKSLGHIAQDLASAWLLYAGA